MISKLNIIDSIFLHSDMIWYPSKTLSNFCPFCDNQLKQVRENATLHPHLIYNKTNNDAFESEKNDDDTVESKRESNDDAFDIASYNGPYKSKNYSLLHVNHCSKDCNDKMKCTYHYWF